MKIKSDVKAGGLGQQRNQTDTRSLKVKTNVKAGGLNQNHNQTTVRGLKVKSGVKAGIEMRKAGGDQLSAGKPF
jgi:hypothetical protein